MAILNDILSTALAQHLSFRMQNPLLSANASLVISAGVSNSGEAEDNKELTWILDFDASDMLAFYSDLWSPQDFPYLSEERHSIIEELLSIYKPNPGIINAYLYTLESDGRLDHLSDDDPIMRRLDLLKRVARQAGSRKVTD
jgi:hypothetical protein